ncbi:ammonium transporter Rh type A [Eurytemora carolleeae]|uniref:ammonium transporter Rh type A n=1 Tax=Eurytemora carolleeae TaxID=1294199 RepID=UPI000C78CCBE|nr:ammonium transporter Rh type A [Eurytemora carolleeae]|eukprot:XP_023323296.1 ammonium transporter Rh type A-like [Eurytemora affinis]
MRTQEQSQIKFLWTLAMIQIIIVGIFFLLGRYDDSSNPKNVNSKHGIERLKYNLNAYPLGVDIFMMLFGGFGYLMTFLKKYGLGAVGLTMIITAVVTEFTVIVIGLTHINSDFVIEVEFITLVEAGVTATSVLITFGALIGKVNPLQMLVIGIIECIIITLNMYLGYKILGANDVGGAILIHTFGAYFGLAVSLALRNQKVELSFNLEEPRYTSDITSLLGTVFLWVFWPSFNGILAVEDARLRCYINTYLSLCSSTVATFVISGLLGNKKFCPEDVQNATLAGGVMVGATADMVLQPYGACLAGTLAGIVSTIGFKYITPVIHRHLRIHDTCGVHNLHGLPGIMSGLSSVLVVLLASEDSYGANLYKMFPLCAPLEGTHALKVLQQQLPELEGGEGRSVGFQALVQLLTLGATLLIAIVSGLVVGIFISIQKLFDTIPDEELFDDDLFWNMPDHDDVGYPERNAGYRRKSRSRSMFNPGLAPEMELNRKMSIVSIGHLNPSFTIN